MRQRGQRAVIYTRVSRDDTGEGRSNDRQREDCEKLADLRGWTVVGLEQDVSVSAYSGKRRPAWQRVVDAMRAGEVDVVVAWHMDRITRTVKELTEIVALSRECGVGVATVNGDIDLSNDTGKMVATILGAVAEAEVERKGARQRRANQQRAAEGYRWRSGWRSFGYEQDGIVIASEADLIREAAADVLNGASLNSIAKRWQASGVHTPRNAATGWSHQGVKSILTNPKTAGLAVYRGEVTGKGDWEGILTEQQHAELVALLTDAKRLTRSGGSRSRRPETLLTGIATCATCGESVQGGSRSVGEAGSERQPVYLCPSYHVATPRDAVDELVRRSVWAALAMERPGKYLTADQGATAPMQADIDRLRQRLNALGVSFAEGRITIEQLEAASVPLREGIARAEQGMAEMIEQGRAERVVAKAMDTALGWLDASLDEQRALLGQVADVVLHPRGRGKRGVPIDRQVTLRMRDRRGGVTTLIDAARNAERSSKRHEPGSVDRLRSAGTSEGGTR